MVARSSAASIRRSRNRYFPSTRALVQAASGERAGSSAGAGSEAATRTKQGIARLIGRTSASTVRRQYTVAEHVPDRFNGAKPSPLSPGGRGDRRSPARNTAMTWHLAWTLLLALPTAAPQDPPPDDPAERYWQIVRK